MKQKTENTLLWLSGRIVLPDRICENGSVLIENGRITAVNEACPDGAEIREVADGYILPGFVDIHVHGGGGADFMDCTADAVRTVARAHCEHGTTALSFTSMTCDDEMLEKAFAAFHEADAAPTGGADLIGIHLEGPFFASKGNAAGAQPTNGQRYPTREMLEHFIELGKGRIWRWDAAPELPGGDVFAEVMKEHGILASVGHTAAMAPQAHEAFDRGYSHVTHLYSATTMGGKVDGVGCSGLNATALIRDDVSVEVIMDGCHLGREHTILTYRMKGSDKMILITDAIRAAGQDVTESILGNKDTGTRVIIWKDAAHLPDKSYFAGSIGTMDRALRTAHLKYGLPLTETVKMMTLTPARLAGIADRKGSLEVGKDADVVIMDDAFQVKAVYVRGELRHQAE